MSTIASNYLRVAHGFSNVLASVKEDSWQNKTPCDDWNATELTKHVIATHQRVYSMIGGDGIEGFDAELPLQAQWIVELRAYENVLNDDAIASIPVQTRAGEQPFSELIEGLLMIDTLCHTWDLARATGADETLDPVAVSSAHAKLVDMDQAIRVPGGFKDAIVATPDANAQTKFLNFTGRVV
jgi:uncharacterized protein (TIGR03086 family)